MKPLNIKLDLSEETEVGSVWMVLNGKAEIMSEHITDDVVAITDHSDYSKVYCIQSRDFYRASNQAEEPVWEEAEFDKLIRLLVEHGADTGEVSAETIAEVLIANGVTFDNGYR